MARKDAKRPPKPQSDLKKLDRLVGTWKLEGDTKGTSSYQWMEGGFFLIQNLDMMLFGHRVKAVEFIGHFQPFGENPSVDIRSRSYDANGHTFDYVYEIEGHVLTIWGGEKGSNSYFRGVFSDDWRTNTGEWVFPGGGYKSIMKRQKNKGEIDHE
jgi:hypothetical protein